jgi:hypothetical protein
MTPATTWQQIFTIPAGGYEYKATINDAWTENYGLHAARDGANIPLTSTGAPIKFFYDNKSHWVTDNVNSLIETAPGSFQSELGCPAGDWQPDCLRSWLQDIDGDGIYTFTTTAIPAGSYESKVTIGRLAENYGQGGPSTGPTFSSAFHRGGAFSTTPPPPPVIVSNGGGAVHDGDDCKPQSELAAPAD